MSKRNDIHKPSVIVPADYTFVCHDYIKVESLGDSIIQRAERERFQAHKARTGASYSNHDHGGTCHICGAHALYTAVFHHIPSNTYVRTGLDCAENLEYDSGAGELFRKNIGCALEAQAGKRKAQAFLSEKGLDKAWEIYASKTRNIYGEGARVQNTIAIVVDIVFKLVRYGNLSDKQVSFLGKLVGDVENAAAVDAQRAAETAAAKPVPVNGERITVRGTILTIRQPDPQDGGFGQTRTLVQHADGWKVWGSLPSNISDAGRGDLVEFSATVKVSDKNPKFGFYSRPTKARKVA